MLSDVQGCWHCHRHEFSPMQRPLPRRVIEQIAVFIIGSVFSYSVCSIELFLNTVLVLCRVYCS